MSESEVGERLERIEALLESLIEARNVKEYYSTSEVAEQLGRVEFTVREWCRLGRVWAEKRASGRGASKEWMISQEELDRIKNEGLLPLPAGWQHWRLCVALALASGFSSVASLHVHNQ